MNREISDNILEAKIITIGEKYNLDSLPDLLKRKTLAMLKPVFSSERIMETVRYSASEELFGRTPGSLGINKSIDYIAEKF